MILRALIINSLRKQIEDDMMHTVDETWKARFYEQHLLLSANEQLRVKKTAHWDIPDALISGLCLGGIQFSENHYWHWV